MTNNEIRELLKSKEYNFLREDTNLGNRIMLLTLGGSYSYGTNVSSSDVDIRGIVGEKPEEIIGLETFELFEDKNTDTTIYGFNKMFEMLVRCNPNTIEILGTDDSDVFYMSKEGKLLRDNASMFLSQQAQYPFAGYAQGKLVRLKNILAQNSNSNIEIERHMVEAMDYRLRVFNDRFTPVTAEQIKLYIGESDKSTIDEEIFMNINLQKYPLRDFAAIYEDFTRILKTYSSVGNRNKKKDDLHLNKHAMHLVRFYMMAIDILEKEKIITKRINEQSELLAIRNGKYQKPDGSYSEDFYELITDYEKKLKYAVKNTSLPKYPDFKKLQELKMEINRSLILK